MLWLLPSRATLQERMRSVNHARGRAARLSSRAGSGYHPCVSELETAPPEAPDLLEQRIDHLGLRLEGSPVERFVTQLYRELERKGLRHFRPVCYLTDEWGCPDQEPVIGVPFYLAVLRLHRIEGTVDLRERKNRGEARASHL